MGERGLINGQGCEITGKHVRILREREREGERDKLLSMFRISEIKFMLRVIMELIRLAGRMDMKRRNVR